MEIIHEAEGYDRGFYTGVMGIYNNGELNSAVMIRFLENDGIGTYFKAGGGITSKSDCRKEYEEVLQKADITLEDLRNANKVSLFNAMIEFGERKIAMENVHF